MRGKNFLKPIPVVGAALILLNVALLVWAYFCGELMFVASIYLTLVLLFVIPAFFIYLLQALLENDWGWWK